MATPAIQRIRPFVPPSREQAAQLLILMWSDLCRVSLSLQQLDEPVVRHSEWGDLYANAQGSLDAMLELVANTLSSPYPAEAERLQDFADDFTIGVTAAKYAVRDFEWSTAHGALYAVGLSLYRIATNMGVEL